MFRIQNRSKWLFMVGLRSRPSEWKNVDNYFFIQHRALEGSDNEDESEQETS